MLERVIEGAVRGSVRKAAWKLQKINLICAPKIAKVEALRKPALQFGVSSLEFRAEFGRLIWLVRCLRTSLFLFVALLLLLLLHCLPLAAPNPTYLGPPAKQTYNLD